MKTLYLIPAAALCAAAASAGTVEVATQPTANYVDAGKTTWDAQSNVQTLTRYLQRLGKDLLPAGHVLKVELLDVDLAGTQFGDRARVVTGGADWPRIRLRYTLQAPGQPVRTAEEVVQDMNYTRGLVGVRDEPLPYEKRMLRAWFRERFASPGQPHA